MGCVTWLIRYTDSHNDNVSTKTRTFRLIETYVRLPGKYASAAIQVRVLEPDFSDLPEQYFDWGKMVYGKVEELLPTDAPKPLGKAVTTVHYTDVNLQHDLLTGRAVTGILHLLNLTPGDWYSKGQATLVTATFGSEFTAARIPVNQILDLRTTLQYLGVPVNTKTYMFGDNQAVHKKYNTKLFTE
jgi:hypothetical protein